MTEIENRTAEAPAAWERTTPTPPTVPAHKTARGGGVAGAALALAIVALLAACASLYLQLRPAPEPAEEEVVEEVEPEPQTIQFRNHVLTVLDGVPVNEYTAADFHRDADGYLRCGDAPLGVDVSSYQGEIDWARVAAAGVKFAMIRVGLRGYTIGGIQPDAQFRRNIEGALAAGLDVGVYFFSQAINVWEAEEEADYVLAQLKGYELTYPVVFDWERIGTAKARTDNVGAASVTRCAGAFCDMIADAGYTPMIYFNLDQGYLSYQLDRLTDYGFWLAEYQDCPTFYYRCDLWQYTHRGKVDGIDGAVDLDLDLRAAR